MNINDFLVSPIPEIKDLAEKAEKIETSYKNGEISFSEYTELANDVLELKNINTQMIDLEIQRELWRFVQILQQMKFFASLM